MLMNKSGHFPFLLAGTKVKEFDPSPKGFIPLVSGFRSLPFLKAAIFMHHDFAVLEQVTYHTFKPPNIYCWHLLLSKDFTKDPLESDSNEVVKSQSDDTKEDNKAAIVDSPAFL